MAAQFEPDSTLMGMPSLSAIKAFLAAAKYKSFTAAAGALCVTQAAVSKQVKELESYMGTELFERTGRSVLLTPDGEMFKDAAQLSFTNILQATERLRKKSPTRQSLTVCCTPAFSSMWLQPRLLDYMDAHSDVEITVLATQNFLSMEAGLRPDVYIAKMALTPEGYDSTQLFDDVVYPVCTPGYLERVGPIESLDALRAQDLLDLNPYGRAQVSEHVDWNVWLSMQGVDQRLGSGVPHVRYSSNDYRTVVDMALAHRGLALGWDHLVGHLVQAGQLVRPVAQAITISNRSHYLVVRKDRAQTSVCQEFCVWIAAQLGPREMQSQGLAAPEV